MQENRDFQSFEDLYFLFGPKINRVGVNDESRISREPKALRRRTSAVTASTRWKRKRFATSDSSIEKIDLRMHRRTMDFEVSTISSKANLLHLFQCFSLLRRNIFLSKNFILKTNADTYEVAIDYRSK